MSNKADKYLKETIAEILEEGQVDNIKLGEKREMNCGEVCKIVAYHNSENITVLFENTNILLKNKTYHNFKKGSIKNPYTKKIYNKGFIGLGQYSWVNNPIAYKKWHGILDRCYSKYHQEKYPTYKGVTVCEQWLNFQNFAQWFEKNHNPEIMEHWHLDKDIICKECKTYSPETCAFVPADVNNLFIKNDIKRGVYPISVRKTKSQRFTSRLNSKHLGTFDTPEEAFQAYKVAKEEFIKEVAYKWKGLISPKVYEAMYNYQVEITD